MDVNNPEVQQKLRNLLSRYKRNGEKWDIVCVIGKDNESDVILGSKDIAKYLTGFFKYYANPELFPNKPKLEYELVETIADKFNDLMKKFEFDLFHFELWWEAYQQPGVADSTNLLRFHFRF